jgi:DUF2993 family protein
MRTAAIWIVAVVALLLLADRGGVLLAESSVADTLQSSQHLASSPDVDIAGFPFLTQLVARDLDEITVTAHNFQVGNDGDPLRISTVTAVMKDVKIDLSLNKATIGSAKGTGVIRYADLARKLGVDVSYAGGGKVRFSKDSISVAANPQLIGGSLQFGGVSVRLLARLANALGAGIDLSRVPFGLSVESLTADSTGITVRLSGRNVILQKQG